MLKKKLMLLFLGIFLILSVSASTTQITRWGATVLQTDDNFTEFRDALLTFPDCHMSKAKCNLYEYFKSFCKCYAILI